MLRKVILAEPELCTGCKQCEMVCSFAHEGAYSPALSRIRLVRFEDKCLSVPVTCAYCERPVCEEVCPTGAMTTDPQKGTARVVEAKCIGCKECVSACPIGAVEIHPEKGVAFRCDLCEGDPACVKACPTGALKYVPISHAARDRRRSKVLGWSLMLLDPERRGA